MTERREILLDLLLFVVALSLALWQRDDGHSIVWGMWLSSLLIGYTYIVSSILRWGAAMYRVGGGMFLFGLVNGLFLLAFFTVHFGGFHLGHAIFLNEFFPIPVAAERQGLFLDPQQYLWVVKEYWWFLLIVLVSDRHDLLGQRAPLPQEPQSTKKAMSKMNLMKPYAKVVRLHILIFVFAGAQALQWSEALVLVIIHAAYFLPWRRFYRLVKPHKATTAATAQSE